MKSILLLLVFSSIIPLTSCSINTNVTLTRGGDYPALDEKQAVRVCLTEEIVDNFEEIGLIEVYFDPVWRHPHFNDIVEAAKETAREYGANCIILIDNTFRPWQPRTSLWLNWFRMGTIKK